MAAEIWILLIILTSAVAAGAGFAFARRGAPSQTEIDSLQQELELARKQATAVQDNVTEHFEQSALLFGRLAHDYRDFLEHFSESAKDLGIDEVRARELLERADLPLLGDNRNVIDAEVDNLESAVTSHLDDTEQASVPAEQANVTAEVEPPLIEDVVETEHPVEIGQPGSAESHDTLTEGVASTVVDVELVPEQDGESVKKAQPGL